MRYGDGFATGPSAAAISAPLTETTGPGSAPASSLPGTRSSGRGLRLPAAALLAAFAWALPPATADAQDRTLPRVSSIERQTPTDYRTAANSLTWRVTFNEDVQNVDSGDFRVKFSGLVGDLFSGVAAASVSNSADTYDVTMSASILADHNGIMALEFAPMQDIADLAGNELLNTHPTGTYGTSFQFSYLVDNAAPSLHSATATGTKLTLTFDEDLDTSSVPASTNFGVKVAGTTQTLATTDSVAISGRKVTVTLPSAVTVGQAVTFYYTVPTTNPIKDTLGHSAAAIGSSTSLHTATNLTARNASGKPKISNSPNVGNKLHASVKAITDPQGIPLPPDRPSNASSPLVCWPGLPERLPLCPAGVAPGSPLCTLRPAVPGPQCAFQWIRVDGTDETDIAGATERTYRLAEADFGKRVKMRVSFDDKSGNRETVTSDAYPPSPRTITEPIAFNSEATGAPSISGTAEAGATLTAGRGTIRDADGLPDGVFPIDYRLQWLRVDADGSSNPLDIPGATSPDYRLTRADAGKRIKLRATFKDQHCRIGAIQRRYDRCVAEADSATDAQLLAALDRDSGNLTPADRAKATANLKSDCRAAPFYRTCNTETVQSGAWPASGTIAALPASLSHCNPANRNELWCAELTAGHDATGNRFGRIAADSLGTLSPSTFTDGGSEVTVSDLHVDADDGSFLIALSRDLDAGRYALEVGRGAARREFAISLAAATDTHSIENSGLSWSDGDRIPVKFLHVPNRPAAGAPEVFGQALEGATLTVSTRGISDADGLENVSYGYQWIRTDSDGSSNAAEITNATSRTYSLVTADVGKRVKVRVTFTDDDGFEEELTSPAFPSSGTVGSSSVLVSNIDAGNDLNANSLATYDHAQGFRIAAGRAGATLTGIQLRIAMASGTCSSPPSVRLVTGTPEAGGGIPLSVRGSEVRCDGTRINLTYTAPANTVLRAGNTYYVVAEGIGSWFNVASNNEDTAATGWTIDDVHHWRNASLTGRFQTDLAPMKIRVHGTPLPANNPAAGGPVISGLARQGVTLRASTDRISDLDGMISDRLEFQWVRVDSDGSSNRVEIAGATSSTYTLAAADVGKRVKVEVSFRDDNGYLEELASGAWPSTRTVTGFGTHDHCNPSDPDEVWCSSMFVDTRRSGATILRVGFDLPSPSDRYGRLTPDSFVENGNTVTLNELYLDLNLSGGQLYVKFDPAIAAGSAALEFRTGAEKTIVPLDNVVAIGRYSQSNTGLSWSNGDRIPVKLVRNPRNSPAAGAPTISGEALVDGTLTAATGGIRDANRLTDPGWLYQWFQVDADGESNPEEILGATMRTYTPTKADVGRKLKVRVRFLDNRDNRVNASDWNEELTSAAYPPNRNVRHAHCSATDPKEIWCAEMEVGTGSTSTFQDGRGYLAGSGSGYGRLSPSSFTHAGKEVGVQQLAHNGTTGPLSWMLHVAGGGSSPRIASGQFVLHLKWSTGEKYFRYSDPSHNGTSWTGHGLDWSASEQVEVRFLRVGPNLLAGGNPQVTGTARVGEELTTDLSGIADANGLPEETGYSYQWLRVDSATEAEIEGATSKTYTLTPLDFEKQVRLRVSFNDNDGYAESLTSAVFPATGSVAAAAGTAAHPHCDPANPDEVWCTVMTVGSLSAHRGYNKSVHGSLASADITWPPAATEINQLTYNRLGVGVVLTLAVGGDRGNNGFALEIGTGADKKTFTTADNLNSVSTAQAIYQWDNPGLNWSDNDEVPVKLVRLTGFSEGPRLEAPAGTKGWLRVRWNPEPGAGTVVAYHVRWKKASDPAYRYSFERADAVKRDHLLHNLEAGAQHDVRVCEVSALTTRTHNGRPDGRLLVGMDTVGRCSAWSRITMPSGTVRNHIRVSIEFPDGGESVTLGSSENTVNWRFRVSGIRDTSKQTFASRNRGVAVAQVVLQFRDEDDSYRFTVEDSGGSTSTYSYPVPQASRSRAINLAHLTIDGVGTGYVEQTFNVGSHRNTAGKGPLMLYLLEQGAQQLVGSGVTRTEPPRELCVQVNSNEACSTGQVLVEPPAVDGFPVLSGAGDDGTWSEGETVGVALTFSEAVEVDTAGGTPGIGVALGGLPANARSAAYASGRQRHDRARVPVRARVGRRRAHHHVGDTGQPRAERRDHPERGDGDGRRARAQRRAGAGNHVAGHGARSDAVGPARKP